MLGTQKLLNSELQFKKLVFIVIDEEHRFGVTQKEKIKSMRGMCTFLPNRYANSSHLKYGSFGDTRFISDVISTKNRVAIKTFVSQYSEEIVQEAVRRELREGGKYILSIMRLKLFQGRKAAENSAGSEVV